MKNTVSVLILMFLLLQPGSGQAQLASSKPRLVVGLVIDQMRWDYLYRFNHHFSKGGFRRLMEGGFSFENAMISYSPTMTATGHASIYTGAYPAMHGIVGNEWVERKKGAYTYCTDDADVFPVGGGSRSGKMSPKLLLATTIGDELKLSNNFRSRVYGISLKDRGAIMAGGRSGNGAYWLDDSTGNWITSSWYMNELPEWATKFNTERRIDKLMQAGWQLSLPETSYENFYPDSNEFEVPITPVNRTSFPHQLKQFVGKAYTPFRYTPMGNTLTLDFARSLVSSESVGKGSATDMLCISLSAPDYIGHKFGPFSRETEDAYVLLDKELASFLLFLDEAIGKENYLLFLTADHAAPPIPDYLKSKKLSAGNLDNYRMVDDINQFLFKKFGHEQLVSNYFNSQYYINMEKIESLQMNRDSVSEAVLNYLMEKDEVMLAFDFKDLYKVVLPLATKEMIARGYHRKRSGDIHVILKPQYVDYLGKGSEHGTIYNYDRHVPLLFFGSNIKPGRSHRAVSITDIAPTLSAILEVQCPNASEGEVLPEIIPGEKLHLK